MANLVYKQELTTTVTKTPTTAIGACMNSLPLQRELSEVIDITEDSYNRFMVPASTTIVLNMGTIEAGKIFVVRSERAVEIEFTNAFGTAKLPMRANATSVVHMDFTGITITNSGTTDANGYYYLAGD
jgi:hypothetical protein